MDNLENTIERISQNGYGRSRKQSILNRICLQCGKDAKMFKDDISKKEFGLSGFCQNCQDDFFE